MSRLLFWRLDSWLFKQILKEWLHTLRACYEFLKLMSSIYFYSRIIKLSDDFQGVSLKLIGYHFLKITQSLTCGCHSYWCIAITSTFGNDFEQTMHWILLIGNVRSWSLKFWTMDLTLSRSLSFFMRKPLYSPEDWLICSLIMCMSEDSRIKSREVIITN